MKRIILCLLLFSVNFCVAQTHSIYKELALGHSYKLTQIDTSDRASYLEMGYPGIYNARESKIEKIFLAESQAHEAFYEVLFSNEESAFYAYNSLKVCCPGELYESGEYMSPLKSGFLVLYHKSSLFFRRDICMLSEARIDYLENICYKLKGANLCKKALYIGCGAQTSGDVMEFF